MPYPDQRQRNNQQLALCAESNSKLESYFISKDWYHKINHKTKS